ncbi:MAG: RING finger domain-containing protein [Promethearchaeota archaeon]
MPSCIICHLQINESYDSFFECINGHPIHKKCLAEWLLHSQICPLCNDPYPLNVLERFKGFMEEKEKEKQDALLEKLRKESEEKVKKVTNKIAFLKFIDSIEHLIDDENYNVAIDLLMNSYNEDSIDDKNLKILFLLGKVNFLRGRYDLAINFLFKLVKLKFDYLDAFYYLGMSYEALGMTDKANWAYERVKK